MRIALALAVLLLGEQASPLQPFSDYFFEAKYFRIEKPGLDDYLKLRHFQELLRESVDPARLGFDERIDFELLNLWIDGRLDHFRLHHDLPFADALLPSNFGHAWVSLLSGGGPALIRHARVAAARMRALKTPALSAAQGEAGRAQVEKIRAHLGATRDIVRADYPDRRDIAAALDELDQSLQELRLEASPDAQAPPDRKPAPGDLYQHLLRYQIYSDYTAETLREFGKTRFEQTRKELEALARRIDPKKTWTALVEETKKNQFTAATLHDESGRLAARARDFAVDRGLVTVPEAARDFEIRRADPKDITPFGHYQPAGRGRKGAYVSAPLPEKISKEELDQRLRDNNLYWTTVVALHETVPGHHLQFEVLRGLQRSPIRGLYSPTTYVEGWGLYCEHMMFLNGYFGDDPLYELTLLRMKLWRCARVMIDVGLQTGAMTREQAVDLLVKEVCLEPVSAKSEIEHYQSRPTYFTGYLIGYEFFVALRQKCKEAMGARFDQKAFHDRLLSVGPLPMAQLERVMLHWAKPD